jgi:Flp pilus assembly protein TadB
MLNDCLPAIVSVGILAGAFLFVWISDVRRMRRFNVHEQAQTRVLSMIEIESSGAAPDVDAIG